MPPGSNTTRSSPASSPIPFLRKGSREELIAATGERKLPVLKLPDGSVLAHSRAILAWIARQR
ncbi:MAG: glutathione S-transferase N-terminal domain-containing protein [Solirubrobacteraceae bacterium]